MTPPSQVPIFTAPLGGKKLTPKQWRKIESFLDNWKLEVLAAARAHPARSYKLGVRQIEAFGDLLAGLKGSAPIEGAFGGVGPTMENALAWSKTYTLHELNDALDVYLGRIKDALLYGIRGALNPTAIASLMYRATQDATINWRMIARTELARANAMGRLHAIAGMGYDRVWCPPHVGSCASCKRLIENKDFALVDVVNATNFGRPQNEWVACIPLHPNCRHSWLPYDEEIVGDARRHYAKLEAAGLTDEGRLEELFDSSGQLRPEASDVDLSAAEWDDTGKTLDVYAEGLAAVIAKRQNGIHKTSSVRWVPADELRVDLYQRAMDPDKVLHFHRLLRRGKQLPRPRVSAREDGTHYVYDGQHRVTARKLNGEDLIECDVATGMGPLEEAAACREAIAKCWTDPASSPLGYHQDADDVAKALQSGPATLAEALSADISENDQDAAGIPAVDPLLWDGARLRDDVALALETWWGRVAGDDWPEYSQLYVPLAPGVPVRVMVDYDQLRAHHKQWRELTDTDLHLALVASSRNAGREVQELAPGLPMDLRIIPANPGSHPSDDDDVGPLWGLGAQAWTSALRDGTAPEPLTEKSAAERWPAYAWSGEEAYRNTTRGEASPLLHRLVDGELVAKAGAEPQESAPNTGVEHWITIHPHGESDKGQPVLVRNNSDGTMSVIGGAGGALNYMRIDPKRRISAKESRGRDKAAADADRAGLGGPTQTLTEEERQRQEAEFKKNQAEARKTIERADTEQKQLQEQLQQFVESGIGAKWLTHGLIRHSDGREEEYELGFMERKQAMRRLVAGALQTLTLGEQDRREAEASPYLFTEKHGDFEGMPEGEPKPEHEHHDPDAPDDDTSTLEEAEAEQERKVNKKLPPLSEDQAEEVMRLEREIARWGRVKSKARGVLNAGKDASTAYALEWSDRDIREDVKRRVLAEKRTMAARDLLAQTDKNTYKASYTMALQQGALDTVDAFSHSVIGRTALSPKAVKLLGPVGSAQLIAHAISDRADAVGDPEKLSIDKVREALSGLAQSIEADVSGRALARARVAMDVGVSMRDERRASAKGHSLWTETMARSYEIDKLNQASSQLGMAIGGFQACSALQVALEQPPETIDIPGGRDAGALIERAREAGITLKSSQIEKTDGGNLVARVPFEQLKGLFDFSAAPDYEHRERLKAIRTGKGLSKEIEANRDTPQMVDRLNPEQAQGKMFLLESAPAGSNRQWNLTGTPIEKKSEDLRAQMQLGDVLDFAPGVGKTHTGIAAALQLMHDEPEKNHRVLVVAPRTALGPWLGTALKQDPGITAQVMGIQHTELDRSKGQVELRSGGGKAFKQGQMDAPCQFNIISHDQLKKNPNIGKELGCTILITDEAQKFKNERNQRSSALQQAGEAMGCVRPKMPSRSAWNARYAEGKRSLETGNEHILREDKVRQFREGELDDHLFHMDAAKPGAGDPAAGIGLPDREQGNANLYDKQKDPRGYLHHEVTLDDDHRADIQALVQRINTWRKEAKANGTQGPIMGGQPLIEKALLDRPGNAFAKKAADVMAERLAGTNHWDGWKGHPKHADGENAGDYAKKGIVFNQGVQELRHLVPELEAKGIKVFATVKPMDAGNKDGPWQSVDSIENDKVLADYLKYSGQAVLVTTDLNSTARSLQFGDNNGTFQHGATEMLHYGLPDNNATIQQREARIHRRGAVLPVAYHKLQAPDMPALMRQNDRLQRELRTQQLTGNSEQLVGGKETLRHRLAAQGVAPANELQTDEEKADHE